MNKGTFSVNKLLIVVADADFIVSQAVAEDSNHLLALELAQKIDEKGTQTIFPSTAIAEAAAALQRKFSNPHLAARTLDLFSAPGVNIESVDMEIIQKASKLFNPTSSKHNTIFDCIVATIAKKHNADAIFSFDSWYSKLGFKLVSDLFKNHAS